MMNKYFALLALAFCIAACKSPTYISKPNEFKYYTKGLLLEYQLTNKSKGLGEIIEAGSTSITLLDVKSPFELSVIPRASVESADILVALTSEDPEKISLFAGLINFISLAHGGFAIISLPINLIFTISISNDAANGTYKVRHYKWEDMYKFARFPQGIPTHIDQTEIR